MDRQQTVLFRVCLFEPRSLFGATNIVLPLKESFIQPHCKVLKLSKEITRCHTPVRFYDSFSSFTNKERKCQLETVPCIIAAGRKTSSRLSKSFECIKNFDAMGEEGRTAFPMTMKRIMYYSQTETSSYIFFMHKNYSPVLSPGHQSIKYFLTLLHRTVYN